MAQAKSTRHNIVTRCLATMALVSVYCVGIIGASAVLLTAATTSAEARGGGGGRGRGGGGGFRGGGFRGGGYRGGGWGRGRGYGFYGPRIVAPGCYYSRRWGRVVCPY